MAHDGALRSLLRDIAEQKGYCDPDITVKEITSGGANYTTVLYLATITSPKQIDLNLFAKVASFSEKIRSTVNADCLFRTEQLIYNKLVKIWESLQETYQIPEEHKFVFPKFYGSSPKVGSETVILEDLTCTGYDTYDRMKSVDWEHASKSVELLAKYHAFSFILQKDDPVEYETVSKDLKFQLGSDDESSKGVWMRMIASALEVLNEADRDKVVKFFERSDGKQMYVNFRTPRGRPILIHGDYRPSNLMYRRKNNELEAIAIDYQTVHTGCPVNDLIYFIFMGSDAAFRKDHYQQLIDHYYEQLGLALGRFKIEIDEVYPRKEFDGDLKEMLPSALLLGVIILPVVTVEAESAPKLDGASGLESFIVKPNQLYKERFCGIVSDLVRWGII